MKIIKIVLSVLLLIGLAIAGLLYYLFDTPEITEPPLAGELVHTSIELDRHVRTFHWYKPDSLKQDAPVIFVLHGSTGTGEQIRTASAYEFDLLAEQHGFVVVYPNGYQRHWNDCRRSADYAANLENINDVAFFEAMIERLSKDAEIDKTQVFVSGISNGGHMAYRLALEVPGLFKAHASIAANLPVDSNLDCIKSGKPVSIAIFNGTADPVNPFEGGVVELMGNSSRGEVLSTNETADYWKSLVAKPVVETGRELPELDGLTHTSVLAQQWMGAGGKRVRLYTLTGSGHVIPSKVTRYPRILGESAGDISGPEEIVEFFLGESPSL